MEKRKKKKNEKYSSGLQPLLAEYDVERTR